MSATANNDGTGSDAEKPVQEHKMVFPPFPAPRDEDFEDDVTEEERKFFIEKFPDVNAITKQRLHCTACDRHLGCAAKNDSRMRCHPMLRTLMCHTCYSFYNSGEFEKGDDGSELYCRWCGQGGQVYCCSDCPVVFCAKCIKRNLGVSKIKHIEATDDWKCFKCEPRCLWDLRAVCWALLRYCDLKNKITMCTVDVQLKSIYEKDCDKDSSECCRNRYKRKEKSDDKIKKEKKDDKNADDSKRPVSSIINKIPPTIQKRLAKVRQVKKFAHINNESPKEKKAVKRSASPKNRQVYGMVRPVGMLPALAPLPKKIRMPTMSVMNPIRIHSPRPPKSIQPIPTLYLANNSPYNGYSNPNPYATSMMNNDNINLSLESLTQGLNMSAVSQMSQSMDTMDGDVVCTPDFPLEPLCEVTEDNTDDDVECITPTPITNSRKNSTKPTTKTTNKLPEFSSDNIIQMTENDVTINAATGGLKFRVDPQTLSSNKMYRLPDGRVFAINVNPNMPGGYSATIVAVTETKSGKIVPKGSTFSAKLSSVSSSSGTSNKLEKLLKNKKSPRVAKTPNKPTNQRQCNLSVPVEWFRYNLIDAVDALEYSLQRLQSLKKEANTVFLRSRTIAEMKDLHKHFDRLLNTSSTRFNEIREHLNKEMKKYVSKKADSIVSDDDDDDVEILNDMNDDDDPIFIDENSVDSTAEKNDHGDIDLTGHASSDPNESGEKSVNKNNYTNADDLNCTEQIPNSEEDQSPKKKTSENDNVDDIEANSKDETSTGNGNDDVADESETQQKDKEDKVDKPDSGNENHDDSNEIDDGGQKDDAGQKDDSNDSSDERDKAKDNQMVEERLDEELLGNGDNDNEHEVKQELLNEKPHDNEQNDVENNKSDSNTQDKTQDENPDISDDKSQDTEMTEDMIENLLKDATENDLDDAVVNCMDIPDFQVP